MSLHHVSIGPIKLHVLDEGTGPVILFVHGWPLDHSMWRGQTAMLSKKFRCIAPDLRGFGKSDVTPGAVSMVQFADDLAALLDAMKITQPVVFCGLSMGGAIGWQFWKRHGQRLAKLIVCDARAVPDTEEAKAGRDKLIAAVREQGSTAAAELMMPKLFGDLIREEAPEVVDDIRRVIVENSPEGIIGGALGLRDRVDARPWLGEIEVPTLVICGENDVISTAAEMKQIAAAIPGAKFVVIPQVGHMAPLENGVATNEAIEEFLK